MWRRKSGGLTVPLVHVLAPMTVLLALCAFSAP